MPVYHNPHDYPRSRQVSYTWAMIFAFVFGFFFWFHTTRWRILLVYLIAIIAVWFIPYFSVFWPTIFAGMNAYFAMMAPRICHERWKYLGYRITDDSYDQLSDSYIDFLKVLYKLPSFWLFWLNICAGFSAKDTSSLCPGLRRNCYWRKPLNVEKNSWQLKATICCLVVMRFNQPSVFLNRQ